MCINICTYYYVCTPITCTHTPYTHTQLQVFQFVLFCLLFVKTNPFVVCLLLFVMFCMLLFVMLCVVCLAIL